MTTPVQGHHIVRAFSEELEQLTASVATMGGLAESLVSDALDAIAARDSDLALDVIQRDKRLDTLQRDIERQIIRLLALRQPLASDLRVCIAALKIAADLERIGDLAKNIARRTRELNEAEPLALSKSIERMGRLVQGHLHEVLDAYASGEIGGALGVWQRDDDVDEHYNTLFRELLVCMAEDPHIVGPGAHLLFIAKNLERVGDHATNIAEVVHYAVTGTELLADRPKGGSSGTP
ncbi:MAG: phosphate signaling complex protein PhoU [Oceanicaulis sp.]|uniref:phosphate signaling complex protein PhoU n=1 Tax=Glycocaulis sp. TaxID=1969725 RepID=UPI0025B8F753|nr:phosphate signaling complex protein PhoU [Glycocaulis sp.]MCC5981049.1 phosphate signaling complex protein PhoU [Oceanicaulis sp.]MCH8522642.1 phosphate signaling complex protein PhoU [Glycocaulis sp.]